MSGMESDQTGGFPFTSPEVEGAGTSAEVPAAEEHDGHEHPPAALVDLYVAVDVAGLDPEDPEVYQQIHELHPYE